MLLRCTSSLFERIYHHIATKCYQLASTTPDDSPRSSRPRVDKSGNMYRSEQTYAGPQHTTQISYEEAVGETTDDGAGKKMNSNEDSSSGGGGYTKKTKKLGTKIIKFQYSSSAGAGSGLFHTYRHERRREEERINKMLKDKEKRDAEEAFAQRKAATDKELEAKRAKNASKRQKAKNRKRFRRQQEKEAKKQKKPKLGSKSANDKT